ncbi:MAG: hypothetical protein LC785_11190 [Acidobacteria bacterium]|nr:hypothetical protein [Acidobacteriota bacterium]MCA1642490.1 hypothetical protein [Acidobacteriota bacterium]
MRNRLIILLLLSVLVAVIVTARSILPRQSQSNVVATKQGSFDESQLPVTDYQAPEPSEPKERVKRRAKGARYDKADFVHEPPPPRSGVVHEVTIINDWEVGLPAIPADGSDAVVIGDVSDAQAYLSNDKTGVYSEFSIRIEEVLKNDEQSSLEIGCLITGEREGGRVRFASNRVLPVHVQGQGMPRLGRRYVFFLRRLDQEKDFYILTAYELRAGSVSPLDGVKNSGGSKWKFDAYEGVDQATFLNIVRGVITTLPR